MNRITTISILALAIFLLFSAFVMSGAVGSLLPLFGIKVEHGLNLVLSLLFGSGLLFGRFAFTWNAVRHFKKKNGWILPAVGSGILAFTEIGVIVSHALGLSGIDAGKFLSVGLGLVASTLLFEITLSLTLADIEADKTADKREEDKAGARHRRRLETLEFKARLFQNGDKMVTTGHKQTTRQNGHSLSKKSGVKTDREEQIKALIEAGKNQKQIASEIGVGVKTIQRSEAWKEFKN